MRTPKYLSNSSVSLFYKDREEFYIKYLADNRPPRMKQTRAMSVGSAFDAFVKSHLVDVLGIEEDGFDKDHLFTVQVEEHNRDFAYGAGEICFEAYQKSGALKKLLKELELAGSEPQFESTKRRTIEDIPLLGKPDVYFITRDDLHVILDWKVNGYCSRSGASPRKGYIECLDGFEPRTRKHGQGHKDAQVMDVKGMRVNLGCYLEDVDRSWANQTTLYAWLEGEPVGGKFITGIDQLACRGGKIRIARHRSRVSEKFQHIWWHRIKKCWETIQSGVILDCDDAIDRQALLDDYHKAYDDNDPRDSWFAEVTREH